MFRLNKMSSSKRNMSCNKPIKSWRSGKKRVVKACVGGKEKIIHFGATGYGHNYSSVARRSFRSRHKCDEAKNKLTANYWACKNLWTKGGDSLACPHNRKCKKSPKKSKRRSPKKPPHRKIKSPHRRLKSPHRRLKS